MLSCIWGKETKIQAIHQLLIDPHTEESVILDIVKRTQNVWDRIKIFFIRIMLTLSILLESHRIKFQNACERLYDMMNKVETVVIAKPSEQNHQEKRKLELQINICNKALAIHTQNIPLIEEFDEKSLQLFNLQENIKQLKKKNKTLAEELQKQANVLESEIKILRRTINENNEPLFTYDVMFMKIPQIEAKKKALEESLLSLDS